MATLTFELIAETIVGDTNVTKIEFTGLPTDYTDLRLITALRQGDGGAGASSSGSALTLNNATSAVYGYHYAGANPSGQYAGAAAGSYCYYGETAQDGVASGVFSVSIIDIPNYRNTVGWKQVPSQNWSPNNAYTGSSAGGYMFFNMNCRRSTASTTSIEIYPATTTGTMVYEIGSIATLYGIKAAS